MTAIRKQLLAGGDRDGTFLGNLLQYFDGTDLARFFKKQRSIRRHHSGKRDAQFGGRAAVRVEQQFNVRTHFFPDGFDDCDAVFQLAAVHGPGAAFQRIALQAAGSSRDGSAGLLTRLVD